LIINFLEKCEESLGKGSNLKGQKSSLLHALYHKKISEFILEISVLMLKCEQ